MIKLPSRKRNGFPQTTYVVFVAKPALLSGSKIQVMQPCSISVLRWVVYILIKVFPKCGETFFDVGVMVNGENHLAALGELLAPPAHA
jgi:hypothetical protein